MTKDNHMKDVTSILEMDYKEGSLTAASKIPLQKNTDLARQKELDLRSMVQQRNLTGIYKHSEAVPKGIHSAKPIIGGKKSAENR